MAALALTTALVLLGTMQWVLSAQRDSPHNGGGVCDDCHLNDPEQPGDESRKMLLVEDVDALCRRCHPLDKGLSHPSNVPALDKTSEKLPLDWAGRITCATCHYTHRRNRPDVTGYLIRTEKTGRVFCEACHSDLMGDARGRHSGILNRSHLGATGTRVRAGGFFDVLSLQCLACHDGTVAQASSPGGRSMGGSWQHAQIGLSHPIGVAYPPSDHRARQYRATAELDPRIRLFEGKLGCCSCHEPYSNERHGLIMSNKGSALCLACHKK
ncbi:MAG: hypothetical protein GWP08_01245 [Nitrospiraceae bacterium]|nr:hypothetical protein [Nitrospiraceae bacterium]